MINTLRITTFIAAALAVVFLLLSVAFGLRDDPEMQQFLDSPSVIEKYKVGSGDERGKSDHISPLMQQAQDFARRIQPPKPKKATKSTTKPVARPPRVKAKFSLLGTAVCLFDSLRSLALIDEPGKGAHWVRQSDSVGHLVIDQVNDGNIIVRDGERTETIYAKHPEKKSLLKNTAKKATSTSPRRKSKPMRDTLMTKPFDPRKLPPKDEPSSQRRKVKATPEETPKKQRDSMGISPEEAEDLGDIGAMLQAMEEELLRIEREKKGAETPSKANEPNR